MFLVALIIALLLPTAPLALAQTEQGVVTVHVLYRDTLPPPADMKITRDPEFCGTTAPIQSVTVHIPSGGLKDAVVTIDGMSAPEDEPPRTPPTALSNSRCSFSPHVLSLRTGSLLEIHNQDPVMHNTHIASEVRTFINVAMVANARPVVKKVVKPGLYRVQCDAHKFMWGYVLAFEHPYFGVTDERGHTRILNVPAGEHVISVWHERLGQLRAHVTVPPNGEAAATFEFHKDGADHGRSMNK
jgi:plastocyanin